MMAFEYTNSFIFPFPKWMDTSNLAEVQAFVETLPSTAYIMVLLWWVTGSFLAGLITTKLSKEKTFRLSLIVGIVLTLLWILNNIMIAHDWWFNFVGLPMFLVFTYIGHRFGKKK
jgi:CHASE2 domain-containing sensor protein